MTQYSHVSISVKTFELVKLTYQVVRHFRKEYKYTLGTELQYFIWKVMDTIRRTNILPNCEKREGIQEISMLFDEFKIRFRLAYEIRLVNSKTFTVVQQRIEEVGKMIGGWQKWSK